MQSLSNNVDFPKVNDGVERLPVFGTLE